MEFMQEHLQMLQETADRSKSNTKRLDDLYAKSEHWANLSEAIIKLGKDQEFLGKEVAETKEGVKAMAADIREMREKPGKRWEQVVTKVIELIVAAVVGYALAKLF